jgi:hypothetical protein
MSGDFEQGGERKPSAIKRYLAFEDSPRFFSHPISWLYYVFGIAYALIPISLLVKSIQLELFDVAETFERYLKNDSGFPARWLVSLLVLLAGAFAASFVVLQIWWNRRKVFQADKIQASMVLETFTYLFKTLWETFFTWTAIFGTIAGIASLALEGDAQLPIFGFPYFFGVPLLLVSLVGGYIAVLLSPCVALLFRKILELIIYVLKRVILFVCHIIAQLFEFGFIFVQSLVDFLVNGWRVVIALVAKLGNYLLAYARSSKKDTTGISASGGASITYNA